MPLLLSLRSEILKSKRTFCWYLTIICAAALPIMFVADVCIDGVTSETMRDPWNAFFSTGFMALNLVIFPMFIVLICTLLPQLEYRNNTWKQVFTSPQKMFDIYLSKFLLIQIMILVFFVAFNTLMFSAALTIHFIDPKVGFINYSLDGEELLIYNLTTYASILAITVIQFIAGLRFKSFIVPVIIGFVLWVSAAAMVFQTQSTMVTFFPYCYPILSAFPQFKISLSTILLNSAVMAAVFLAFGFAWFNQRIIKA
ncbi:MAG: ABC transporter permease [Bacteroidota bacterium]